MKPIAALTLACTLLLLGCNGTKTTRQPAAQTPAPVESATCGSIRQLSKVGELYLAGQPSAEDYALLKERGVKTVIDLRTEKESRGFDEKLAVEQLGMSYISLPWNGPNELTDEKLDAMRELLRTSDRPLMMKCGSSNRVGAGWLAYRVLDEGVAIDQALSEAKQVGMRTPAYETKTLAYIQARQ